MSESTAGSSQGLQSILVPESPGSLIIVDSDTPGSPAIVWQEPNLQRQGPEAFTPEPHNITDNKNSTVSRSTVNYDAEDSRSRSAITIPPWTRCNRVENRPHCSRINEDSNSGSDKDAPPAKVRKISTSNKDVDGETCPICLDPWDNSGDHRLVALKCGHLFGLKCVERWLRTQKVYERTCPTCKTKTKIKHIRHIYARRLVATDASQLTTLHKKIEVLEEDKCRIELELQKSCMLQLEFLRSTLIQSQAYNEEQSRKSWRFSLEKSLEINKNGGCRVVTYNCKTNELYVSQKSTNNLLAGYGVRTIKCVDFKLGQFVHLHPRPIRDITYSHTRDLLLSVGLDSSARIVERGISSLTVQSGVPLWSCSWDYLRGNEFYVGGVGGVIHQYDVRNPSTYLQRLQAPSDMSPVVSLYSTEYGLLSSQLNSCWLWVANMRQWDPRALPIEGPFMSLCYDNESHRALVSCRPGSNGERSKLALCKLKASVPSGEILFETEQTFPGSIRSSLMSRASWVRAPGASWVATHSESDSTLYLHGLDGARTMSLPAAEPALDVCSVSLNSDTIVAALSECRLRMYKAVPTSS